MANEKAQLLQKAMLKFWFKNIFDPTYILIWDNTRKFPLLYHTRYKIICGLTYLVYKMITRMKYKIVWLCFCNQHVHFICILNRIIHNEHMISFFWMCISHHNILAICIDSGSVSTPFTYLLYTYSVQEKHGIKSNVNCRMLDNVVQWPKCALYSFLLCIQNQIT